MTQLEARKQVERDLWENLSRGRTICLGCKKPFSLTIDGRCISCYNARTFAIFGVKYFVTL